MLGACPGSRAAPQPLPLIGAGTETSPKHVPRARSGAGSALRQSSCLRNGSRDGLGGPWDRSGDPRHPWERSLPNPAPSQPGIPPVRKRRWKIQGKRQTQTPDVLSSRENAPDPAPKSCPSFGEGAEGWNLSGGKGEGKEGSQSAGWSWSHTWSEKREYQPRWNIPNPSCPDPGVTSGVTNGTISG